MNVFGLNNRKFTVEKSHTCRDTVRAEPKDIHLSRVERQMTHEIIDKSLDLWLWLNCC